MACVKSIAAVCRYLAPAAFYWEADITASNNIKDESLCWTAYNLYLVLPKQRRGSSVAGHHARPDHIPPQDYGPMEV